MLYKCTLCGLPNPYSLTVNECFYYALSRHQVGVGVNQKLKMEKKISADNYIRIEGWMTELKLKTNELFVFAIVHSFSKDGGWFKGSVSYIMAWTGASRTTVFKTLDSLVAKKLIEKSEERVVGIESCGYRTLVFRDSVGGTDSLPVQKLDGLGGTETVPVDNKSSIGGTKTVPGVVQNPYQGGTETVPDNIYINNNNISDTYSIRNIYTDEELKMIEVSKGLDDEGLPFQ